MLKHAPLSQFLRVLVGSLVCAVVLLGQGTKTPAKPQELQWPTPPSEPRIKWVAEYRNEFDVGSKKRTGFMDRLTGIAQDSMAFQEPNSVAVDENGVVFVGDARLGVVGMDVVKKKMWLFSKLSPEAPTLATGLAVDSKYVYATDANQNLVTVFDKEGHRLRSLGGAEGIRRPVGIAVDETRNLLVVVNGGTHQVLLFDRNLKLLKKVGSRGEKIGQFNFPTYCCILPGKGFAVVDTGNFRVQIFSPEGKFLSTFGQQGDFSGSFSRPKGISVDAEGHIYVVDATFGNIQLFRVDGQLLMYAGSSGSARGNFLVPVGIAVAKDGAIWVADRMNHRVQRLQYLPEAKKPGDSKAALEPDPKAKN